MAWNKGTLQMMADPRQEFAEKTGHVLTGLNFRPTLTGWQMIAKRFNVATKTKEVAFCDAYSLEDLFEAFYESLTVDTNRLEWKLDKF